MKIRIVLVLFALMPVVAISQEANSKVKAAYTSAELAKMSVEEIDYLNFFSDNAVIVSNAGEKAQSIAVTGELSLKNGSVLSAPSVDIANFNPLLFNLKVLPNEYSYYRIGDSECVITVMSEARLEVLYERYKANGGAKK